MVFGLSDFLTERVPALQKAVYVLAFTTIYVLFTIKYYYGPDIVNYYGHYESIQSVADVWVHPQQYAFERGYTLFIAILKSWGISLYWITAIISTIYFIAIWMLFKQIPRKRSFALMLLVLFDYSLIYAALRQCLAVAFFIFMILDLQKRRYFPVLIWGVLAASMHKSGIFVVPLCLLAHILHNYKIAPWVFQILMLVLGIMLVLPVSKVASGVFDFLPSGFTASLILHLKLGKQIQSVWIVYAMVVVCVEYYLHFSREKWSGIALVSVIGIAVCVVFYQYFFLLNRLRSYFIPFILVWGFSLVQKAEDSAYQIPYAQLMKQVACLVLILFSFRLLSVFVKTSAQLHTPIYEVCTIFDIHQGEVKALQERQLKRANAFWQYDFMAHEQNFIQ